MDETVLDHIPFQLDFTRLMKRTHIKEGSPYLPELKQLADQAQEIARPKACYCVGYLEEKTSDQVVVDGIVLHSRVLRVNLEKAHRIFPYLATCGMELEEWSNRIDDILARFWADTIKEMALFAAMQVLHEHMHRRYQLGKTSAMSPGSLEDWPITQQTPLFAILGDLQHAVGVKLTDSMLMIPNKTISGIRFPTEENFESCQLCPRPDCPGRRAPYDATLYDRKYQAASTAAD